MDVVSRRVSLTAWGQINGFDKATASRLHLSGELPPELEMVALQFRWFALCRGGFETRPYASTCCHLQDSTT